MPLDERNILPGNTPVVSKHSSPFLILCAALLTTLLAIGCGGDDEPVIILDDNDDNQHQNDDNGADEPREDIDVTSCPSTTDVEADEPAAWPIDEWLIGSLGGSDPVRGDLLDGSFELPEAGTRAYDTTWLLTETGEDGEIDVAVGSRPVYAGTTLVVEDFTVAFARASSLFRVYVNGKPQPGDVYGAGDKYIPIALKPGENHVMLRLGSRATPEFELFTTDDDVYFNTEDLTAPDLRVGTDRVEDLGVQVINLAGQSLSGVEARVLENEYFEESAVSHPALGAGSVSQVAFSLTPKSTWDSAGEEIPVRLQLGACQTDRSYEIELTLDTVAEDATFNRTFRSPVDNSVQYYGVVPPSDFDPDQDYGIAVSMHGASVEASSQARQYTQKDWMYVIAPTNRRPFGFDWEEWGRLNSLASLDHAKQTFNIDPTRVYATGHSMGGHGTWHLGVMHPGRFAALGPSAGWSTFYSYGGSSRPHELIAPARAHSDTYAYMSNLKRRGAYILHGDADVQVPLSEAEDLFDAMTEYTDDVEFYIEEGAGHWWDGDASEGQDCLDWPWIFEFFEARTLDPTELDFEFKTPGQWIGADHSYVSLESTNDPFEDARFDSEQLDEDSVELTTENVRAFDIDAAALVDRGITELTVNGTPHTLGAEETIEIGPREGKTRHAPGLLNPTFQRPFCFVYPDDSPEHRIFRDYAAFLLSNWSLTGNGHGCALPLELLDDEIKATRNLIYIGVALNEIPDHEARPFSWDDDHLRVGSFEHSFGAGYVTFPTDDGHQSAAFFATEGAEHLLFNYQPFSSRAGMPDYYFWNAGSGIALGFFDSDWEFDSLLGGG